MSVHPMPVAGTAPVYELRAVREPDSLLLEIWQRPSPRSPQLREPQYVAGLKGRNLELIEHRVLRQLAKAGLDLGGLMPGERRSYSLVEDLALTLGLMFRVLAPMRNRDNMRMVAAGVEAMGREEAAYWLGMAMHRKNPRRVLMALRFLLIDPKQKS
ncbi:hypothetical protein [Thalassobaculum sp.]|uniref:DUF7680 family protein n=1 Tax=Thalassobaculum sp. TaxID=2022740 RepID=UPI0032EE0DB3